MPSDPVSVRVRMYKPGLGDCFLLTFTQGRKAMNMLIDFGVLLGTPEAPATMGAIAANIADETRGRLDVVAVTHEHWDHVSGFIQAQNEFDPIQVEQVWVAWTEDEGYPLAQALRREREQRKKALQLALQRWRSAAVGNDELMTRVQGLLGIAHGEALTAAAGKTTNDALKYIVDKSKRDPRYLRPGGAPLQFPGIDGVRVYVLGPPEDRKRLGKSDPTKRGAETYDLHMVTDLGFFAALGAIDAAAAEQLAMPFDEYFRMPTDREPKPTGPHVVAYDDPHQEWRKIDNDWLTVTAHLALNLDGDTNNTCLALAIEIVETGDVILFPGDAQVGNWESWHDVTFSHPAADTTSPRTATDLLARTVLYKVGHHRSHNATLRAKGLELMTSPQLSAMVPVNREMAKKQKWNMPFSPLLDRLREKCHGRILQADAEVPDARVLASLRPADRKRFLDAVQSAERWVDITLPTS